MHIVIEYTDEVDAPLDREFFHSVAVRTLTYPQFSLLQEKEITIGVAVVSREKIQALNKQYRKHDSATDVLSFGEYEVRETFLHIEDKQIFLGDIFLCFDFIENSAKEDSVTLEREMVYIFSHGILHLLGFDHEEEMFSIQEAVTDGLAGKK